MADELADPTASTAVLKALANPLRRAIMRALLRLESARATDLSRELDVPANKLSFHLRALAAADLIREDPSLARDKRDRVWAPAPRNINIGSPEHPVEDEALGLAAIHGIVDDHLALVSRTAAWSMEYVTGRQTEEHAMFVHTNVRLTTDEFERLNERLLEVINEFREAHDASAGDTHLYEIDIIAADETV